MRFLNKLCIVLMVLLCLMGCAKEESGTEENIEYIASSNDTNLFSYLNKETKSLLFDANTGETMSDVQLKLLQAKLTTLIVEDIDGNMIDFADYDHCNLVMEIVSVFCSHCKKQLTQFNELIYADHPELTYVQFFAVGTKEEVIQYYIENNLTRYDNVIVLFANDDLFDYVVNIGVELTPTMLCYDDGLVTWASEGVVSLSELDRFYSIAWMRAFDYANLTDENGDSIFFNRRTVEDVKADLSDYNVAKLELLDNDLVTPDLTYSLMGQTVDYSNLYESAMASNPKIDYTGYEDKDVALLYLYMTGLENTDRQCLKNVNNIIAKNADLSFIAMIIEEDVSSYAQYLQYGIELNCPVISSESTMPSDFSKIGAYNYPSVIFIEKGTMTGAYSSFSDTADFAEARQLFIGKDSIAHLNNNQSAK